MMTKTSLDIDSVVASLPSQVQIFRFSIKSKGFGRKRYLKVRRIKICLREANRNEFKEAKKIKIDPLRKIRQFD